ATPTTTGEAAATAREAGLAQRQLEVQLLLAALHRQLELVADLVVGDDLARQFQEGVVRLAADGRDDIVDLQAGLGLRAVLGHLRDLEAAFARLGAEAGGRDRPLGEAAAAAAARGGRVRQRDLDLLLFGAALGLHLDLVIGLLAAQGVVVVLAALERL